jgi:cell division septal protein FtsQ
VAAQVIAGHAAEVAYVDMRYSNGFSVGWRNGSAPAQGRPAAVATGPQNGERDNDA